MSEAIEAFDWSSTSLGPIEGWPLSLKSTLRMVLASKQTICFWWGPDLLSFYNDTYVPLLGKRADNALGRPFRDVWGDVWEAVLPFTQEALAGRGTWSEDLPLEMTRNGFLEQTYWTFSYSPLFDDEGKVAGVLNIVTETTRAVEDRQALKQSYAEAQQHIALLNQYRQQQLVLQNEISHRQKNTLSIIQAIIAQSLRHSPSLDAAQDSISNRIAALSHAQDRLTRESWAGEDIACVVSEALDPHRDHPQRFSLSGPDLVVTAQQALGLSLAIHELATNATKYGALSNPTGSVAIEWSLLEDGTFRFEWRESGGPPVRAPERSGFGSKLTNRIVASYFNGRGHTDYHQAGLHYALEGRITVGDAAQT